MSCIFKGDEIDTLAEVFNQIIFDSGLPALKLNLDFPCEQIHHELQALKSSMVLQIGNKEWKGCALRGIGPDKPRPYYEYGYERESNVPYQWTEISELCPVSRQFISELFPEEVLYRVKINLLEPYGKIHLHTDGYSQALGVSDKTTDDDAFIVAFAVYWPKDVIFNLDNLSIPIQTGDVYLLNFSKFHEVFNPVQEDRYFMAVSGRFGEVPGFRELVVASYETNRYMQFGPSVFFDNTQSEEALIWMENLKADQAQ